MIRTTIAELAARLQSEYAVASVLIKLMVANKQGCVAKVQPPKGATKGKPATVYELNDTFTIKLK